MMPYWRLLLAEFGFEGTILLVLYACLVVACVLALLAQLAWLVAKRVVGTARGAGHGGAAPAGAGRNTKPDGARPVTAR